MRKRVLKTYMLLLAALPMVFAGCVPLPYPYKDVLVKNEVVYEEDHEHMEPVLSVFPEDTTAGNRFVVKVEKKFDQIEKDRSAWIRERDWYWSPFLMPVGVVVLPYMSVRCLFNSSYDSFGGCDGEGFAAAGLMVLGLMNGEREGFSEVTKPWVTEEINRGSVSEPYSKAEIVVRCERDIPLEIVLRADDQGEAVLSPKTVPGLMDFSGASMPCVLSTELQGRTASVEISVPASGE